MGFVGAGSDVSTLRNELKSAHLSLSQQRLTQPALFPDPSIIPVGVGFLLWGAPLRETVSILAEHTPAAAWLFAPRQPSNLATWTREIRRATQGKTKIWIQIGTVQEAVFAVRECLPDVLVVQGQDAGGHGLEQGAGLLPLLPEVLDALAPVVGNGISMPQIVAAGGIIEGRGMAAALTLGAQGVVLGTRYLAAHQANLSKGYRDAVLRAQDGGVSTVRSKVYDTLRGTTGWPVQYGGRGVINASYKDAMAGLAMDENKKRYEQALKRGDAGWEEGGGGRLTTYAGTGVGLVKRLMDAGDITREIREEGVACLKRAAGKL